ncbi:MAG TPA: APC family permease, partial [Acidimicrobiia bacterium]
FLMEGYGPGHLAGVFSWLLYFAAIIITAMVAVSFGSYAVALFIGEGASATSANLFTAAVIVIVAGIQILGAEAISKIQSLIVVILLAVFAVFIVVTVSEVDAELLSPSLYPPAVDIISSIALTFFAYLGFAVISYAGEDLPDPKRDLPKATYIALGITTVLYILISLGVFGTLTVDQVIQYGETALAEAARPVLGDAGFAMMAIAALLATFTSVNANIYGAVGSTSALAKTRQFPPIFGKRGKFGSTVGLTISAVAILLLAVLADLSAIASLGSVVALVIFLMVALAGLRLRAETGSSVLIIWLAIVSTAIVLVVFGIETARNAPETFAAMIIVLVLAAVLEYVWSAMRRSRDAAGPA